MNDLPPIPAPVFQTRPPRTRTSSSSPARDPATPATISTAAATDNDDLNNTTPLSTSEAQSKIARFTAFIATKLRPDLTATLSQRDTLYTTTAHYTQLRHNLTHLINTHTHHITTRIDVTNGAHFYCQAVVPNTDLVAVDVGLGFRVELGLAEAVVVCSERERWLEARAEVLTERASVISAHIKLVYEGIAELMKVQEGAGKRRSEDRGGWNG